MPLTRTPSRRRFSGVNARAAVARVSANARARMARVTAASADKIRKVRQSAKTNAQAERIMTLIEAPAGGAVAGVADAFLPAIKGVVPVSVPAGVGLAVLGIAIKQPDLTRVGAGMLAGAAYGLANTIADNIRG